MTRVLISEPTYRRIEARLSASAAQAAFHVMDENGQVRLDGRLIDLAEAPPEVGWLNTDRTPPAYVDALLASPTLGWVQSPSASLDLGILAELARRGARLTTNHSQAIAMADYVLWGVLDAFQRGPERRAAQVQGRWVRLPFREILDSHWLILGFGAIGQEVARRAKGFGARIVGVRRSAGGHPLADAMAGLEAVKDLLPGADVVVLCLPQTRETRNLADADFFARMRPGSVLVNVCRGGLVDEDALIRALDRGAPGHAVLDVFRGEPLPAESPFWAHPRVTVTGHSSYAGSGLQARMDALFLDNLDRYLTGRPLLNEVAASEVLAR